MEEEITKINKKGKHSENLKEKKRNDEKMLTSEQLRVIYRLYKSVTCTAEFIFLTNMERVP